MRTSRPALAACVLIALTACGTTAAEDAPAGGGAPSGPVVRNTEGVVAFGDNYRFASGIVVAVSAPKPFQPSETAYPKAERAVAFEIAVRNRTTHAYQLSGLMITVIAGGDKAKQVVDAPQGYTGIVNADKDLPPGTQARLNLAFAVPKPAAELKLLLRPSGDAPATATYVART